MRAHAPALHGLRLFIAGGLVYFFVLALLAR